MAKRSMKKHTPAVTRLWFNIQVANNINYVDLSLACSAANRRFYRQGLTWAVAGMTLHTPDGVIGDFDVSKVPDTWMSQQAHKKSKMLWMKSQDQVLDEQPTISARYRDFKVYLDAQMVGASKQSTAALPAVDGDIMLPVDRNNAIAKPGEWVYSELQLPNAGGSGAPLERTMHFVGPDAAGSRSRPQDVEPNTPTTGGWMNDVFDVADNLDEIRFDVSDNNDIPPYRVGPSFGPQSNLEFYPGGVNNQPFAALHTVGFVSGTTVGGKTRVEGGLFNCGLIRFDWNLSAPGDKNMFLAIDLVPGPQKGYLTERYE